MKQLALLTLYTDYQVQRPENRAEDLFLYFECIRFRSCILRKCFIVGREQLIGTERFWKDWITLLKTKRGDVGRLCRKQYCIVKDTGIDAC